MICPNCRCIVPGTMKKCLYCGYRFDNGSAYTVSVTEAYRDRLYSIPEYYHGYSQELSVAGGNNTNYYYESQSSFNDMFFSFETFVTVMLGLCTVLLLMILALLILLI